MDWFLYENGLRHERVNYDIDWTAIYLLPRLATHNNYMRSFQYKTLNNILYLNKKILYFWNKVISTVLFL